MKPQLVSMEVMKAYEYPEGYYNDLVCEGYEGKNTEGKETNFINKMHVVKPNGKLCCQCELVPSKVFNYPHVRTPQDFRNMYCEVSATYMRQEVARLQQEREVTP